MPLDGGVSALFTAEYQRFWQGIRNLDPETREAWDIAFNRRGLQPGETPSLTIPGWDDVIQLGPRLPTTQAERKEFWDALREKREPNLPADVTAALVKRAAFSEAMRTSAAPGYLQGWGDILTAVDNVQDFTSTVATLGRLTIWAAPRIAGRFVPGVGWILTASDLLNALSFMGLVAMPIYALLCAGPTAAVAAGVPGMVAKKMLKGEMWKKMLNNPFSRKARFAGDRVGERLDDAARAREARAASAPNMIVRAREDAAAGKLRAMQRLRNAQRLGRLPSVFNMLEVLQTTDALWGYGLSFGGLVGLAFETTYAAARAARGEAVRINNGWFVGDTINRASGAEATRRQADLATLQKAAGVLAGAAKLQQVQDYLPDDLHLLTMTALAGAIPTLAAAVKDVDWRGEFWEAFAERWAPAIQDDAFTRGWAASHGTTIVVPQAHAVPGNPLTLDGFEYVETLTPLCIDAVQGFTRARRNTAQGTYYGMLVNLTTEQMFSFLFGDDDVLKWELSTDARLLSGLAEDGYLVNVMEPPEAIWRFWNRAREALEVSGDTSLSPAAWLRFAAEAGLTLIKVLPPDATWPPEWNEFATSPGALPLHAP